MFRKDLRLGLTGNATQHQEFNLLWTMFFNCKKILSANNERNVLLSVPEKVNHTGKSLPREKPKSDFYPLLT